MHMLYSTCCITAMMCVCDSLLVRAVCGCESSQCVLMCRDAVREVLDNALTGTQTELFEFPLFTKDGDRLDVLLNATTRRDAKGDIVGVVGVGQDITDKKIALMAEAQLASMQVTLAATSHDLRTPVQSIMHASPLLLDGTDEEKREMRGVLRSSCELLLMYVTVDI